mmetsp:Transcript_14530/g.31614  ORF Transcript_14530/g.31614 Transcript_14530/m.31614 type:complete len:445 (-) Transcript_14530:345-1679(-)
MGPSKNSRKGKKAWRKNIDASEVEEFIKETTHQERRGPAVETLADSDLFFIDKSADQEEAQAVLSGQRKRKQREAKPLRSQLIIEAAHKAKPVKVHKAPPRKVNSVSKASDSKAVVKRQPKFGSVPEAELDIWGADALAAPTAAPTTSTPALVPVAKRARKAAAAAGLPVPSIRAVEVDLPGCSYNPDAEQHQDALAQLVAGEMKKILRKELEPRAPPGEVEGAGPLDELEQLQVEAAADEDENEIPLSGAEDGEEEDAGAAAAKSSQLRKKTKKDRNKERRRQLQEQEQEERQQLKKQRRDLEHLDQLQEDLQGEVAEKGMRQQRRKVVQAEKAATQPPRLGKHKFEPPSVQVLTSDELTGSLRQIKACPMLATDRFKSLQKRGLIEPRKPLSARGPKRVITYEKGARTEKAIAGQEEVNEMRRQRLKAAKQEKKRAAAAMIG